MRFNRHICDQARFRGRQQRKAVASLRSEQVRFNAILMPFYAILMPFNRHICDQVGKQAAGNLVDASQPRVPPLSVQVEEAVAVRLLTRDRTAR